MRLTDDQLGARLLGAAEAGMESRGIELVKEGANPNWRPAGSGGSKPFMAALSKVVGSLAMAMLPSVAEAGMESRGIELVKEGANPNWRPAEPGGSTPFTVALSKGMGRLAMAMLPRADVWATDALGNLPWLIACKSGDARAMRAICEAMARLPSPSHGGWEAALCSGQRGQRVGAVHLALAAASEPCLRVALELGADASGIDDRGMTPLCAASRDGAAHCVETLLKFGAGREEGELREAATWACAGGHPEALAALLDAHPRLLVASSASARGWSLMHVAARSGSSACIAVLLDKGADPSGRDERGATPLMSAAEAGVLETVRALAPHSDLWARDDARRSALGRAAGTDSAPCVSLLAELMAGSAPDEAAYVAELHCALGETRGMRAVKAEVELEGRARSALDALSLRLSLAPAAKLASRDRGRTL